MIEWIIRFHYNFIEDLNKLSKKDVDVFNKKKEKIKQNPLRLKHLSGGENCYREEITTNIRLIYYVVGNEVWFLTIGRHDDAYKNYLKRLYNLKEKFIKR